MKAVKLNLDTTYEVFDLGPYPHLNQQINPDEEEAPFGLSFLNGPTHLHPDHITIGLAVDRDGAKKGLPINGLASSLQGVFSITSAPIIGTAVVVGSTWQGKPASVPYWVIDLVREIHRSVNLAFMYHQNVDFN